MRCREESPVQAMATAANATRETWIPPLGRRLARIACLLPIRPLHGLATEGLEFAIGSSTTINSNTSPLMDGTASTG